MKNRIYYLSQLHKKFPNIAFQNPPGQDHFDTIIVGGGLAGVATAISLLEKSKDHSILITERNSLGYGASGRNGGFVHGMNFGAVEKKAGKEGGKEFFGWTRNAMKMIRRRIDKYELDVDRIEQGMVNVNWFAKDRSMKDFVHRVKNEYGANLEYWDDEQVRELFPGTHKYYDAMYDADAFCMNALLYVNGLGTEIQSKGATICEGWEVSKVNRHHTGFEVLINQSDSVSENKAVYAKNVVLCTSAYDPLGLNGKLSSSVLPVNTYVTVTEPIPEDVLHENIRSRSCIMDNRFACDYYRVLEDNRILWGGRVDAIAIHRNLEEIMKQDLKTIYPNLKDINTEFTWEGRMGYAYHSCPLIGKFEDGLYYNTAFGGHGLSSTTFGGEIIAESILDQNEDRLQKCMTRFPLQWVGGIFGKPAAQAMYTLYNIRDRIKEGF